MKRVAIYMQVSTSKQDTENRRRELIAVAERSSWEVVRIYEDAGISGAKGRDKGRSKTDIVQFASPKEGVNTCISADELPNQFGMTFQQVPGYVLQMLVNQRFAFAAADWPSLDWHVLLLHQFSTESLQIVPRTPNDHH
jgi:hypothetical protein